MWLISSPSLIFIKPLNRLRLQSVWVATTTRSGWYTGRTSPWTVSRWFWNFCRFLLLFWKSCKLHGGNCRVSKGHFYCQARVVLIIFVRLMLNWSPSTTKTMIIWRKQFRLTLVMITGLERAKLEASSINDKEQSVPLFVDQAVQWALKWVHLTVLLRLRLYVVTIQTQCHSIPPMECPDRAWVLPVEWVAIQWCLLKVLLIYHGF